MLLVPERLNVNENVEFLESSVVEHGLVIVHIVENVLYWTSGSGLGLKEEKNNSKFSVPKNTKAPLTRLLVRLTVRVPHLRIREWNRKGNRCLSTLSLLVGHYVSL